MKEFRCIKCGKLLCKYDDYNLISYDLEPIKHLDIEIKCKTCKKNRTLRICSK